MNTHDHHILQGNCIDILPTITSESVGLIVTDPPYLVQYKDRAGRTIANDDSPENVLGAFADSTAFSNQAASAPASTAGTISTCSSAPGKMPDSNPSAISSGTRPTLQARDARFAA